MRPDLLASIHLRRTEERSADVDAAAEQHGRRVGLDAVVADLDRQATRSRVPGGAVSWGFRWNEADGCGPRWWPQGVSTSADADPGGTVGGQRLLLTSWYSRKLGGEQHGSRLTVVDLESLRYRHVLLVAAERDRHGRVALRPLRVHAGGVVWCGPYVHVAGTRRGLLSCRLEDVLEMRSTRHSLGYRYVLPVRFGYRSVAREGIERMRYSFLSLDRGSDPPALVAGEYGRDRMTRRLVRFPLDPATGHLAAGEDGRSRPARLYGDGPGHMQGAALAGDTWYLTVSRGRWRPGHLYAGHPGSFRRLRPTLPPGPEDLNYWPATDSFWSLSEWPGRRFVFEVDRSSLHR